MHTLLRLTRPALYTMCCLVAAWSPVAGQSLTIPELASRGEDTEIAINIETPGTDLATLAIAADVVVVGAVAVRRTRLSEDRRLILTDYEVRFPRVLSSGPERRQSPMPEQFSFSLVGGEMTFDGVTVSVVSSLRPTPREGDEAIVFLQQLDSTKAEQMGVSHTMVDPSGLLEVRGGIVTAAPKSLRDRNGIKGIQVGEVADRLREARTRK